MKYGISYAFWEKERGGDYMPHINKAKRLGFDILEITCAGLTEKSDDKVRELGACAKSEGIIITGGYGPRPQENIASCDADVRENALKFYKDLFRKLSLADIKLVGGGLHTYWPADYSTHIDKEGDWGRSVTGMQKMADMAVEYGITLGIEVINRYEGYILNTAEEAVRYVREVDKPNVKVMLDTFHMNIEEDSFAEAIKTAGRFLGHLHIAEANRRPPGHGRLPWAEIGRALHDIGYNEAVVMEPLILTGGQIGRDAKIFRDMSGGASPAEIDRQAAESLQYIRGVFSAPMK